MLRWLGRPAKARAAVCFPFARVANSLSNSRALKRRCLKIELEGRRRKMRIQWKGTTAPDLSGLSRAERFEMCQKRARLKSNPAGFSARGSDLRKMFMPACTLASLLATIKRTPLCYTAPPAESSCLRQPLVLPERITNAEADEMLRRP